jgi:hypothetical protein
MKNLRTMALLGTLLAALMLLQGCATNIKASASQNPPPAEAFAAYGRIEVKPVVFKDGYKGDHAGLAKIDENFRQDLSKRLVEWNSRKANGRTLTVEPVVEEMSFKHGAKRVLLGPLAGGSGVLMRVTFRDNRGKVVATPEFFQRTAAMSGGFSLGAMDNVMLMRVANLASSYVIANYDHAVGGPTGADDKNVAAQ